MRPNTPEAERRVADAVAGIESRLLNETPSAWLLLDGDGIIVRHNLELELMFGYAPGSLKGQVIEVLLPERHRKAHEEMRRRFFAQPEERRMGPGRELTGLRRTGEEFAVEIGLKPLPTREGLQVLAVMRDVDLRRKAEQQFQAAVECAPLAMILVDLQGRIVLVNREAESLFGYSRMELMGETVEVLLPETLRSAHVRSREAYLDKMVPRRMGEGRDLNGLRKDGSVIPLEIGLNRVQIAEESFVLSVIADITERKKLEEAQSRLNREITKANDALEKSNDELKRFAHVVSHDLQTPLRSIAGFAHLLKQVGGSGTISKADEYTGRIIRGCTRMQALITDLLAYTGIEARPLVRRKVNLEKLCDEIIAERETVLEEQGAKIRRGALPTVTGDSTQLYQLLQNLIDNGLKYHSEQMPEVDIRGEREPGGWRITVEDNGIGIAPKHHERIFEVFKRLHTRETFPGTGIGLAICRRIVERHGGRISLDSEEGQGCRFHVFLPDDPGQPPPDGGSAATESCEEELA